MMIDARDEDFELAEINGELVIFTNARIDRDTVPFDLYCYDVRESEGFSGDPVTLEKVVSINHWGTILSKKPFPLEDDAYYPLKDGINYLEETCTMDIVTVKGVKNMLIGGEGIFNTVVKGPGKVILQTMPISKVAELLTPFFADKK